MIQSVDQAGVSATSTRAAYPASQTVHEVVAHVAIAGQPE